MKRTAQTLLLLFYLSAGSLFAQNREIDTITFVLDYPDCIVSWTSDCTNCTFDLARISDFDPNSGETPEDGTFTFLPATTSPYHDSALWQQPPGYYAYGIREVYSDGGNSDWVYSENIPLYLWYDITVYSVPMCNIDTQDSLCMGYLNDSSEFYWEGYGGYVYFHNVPQGIYDMHIYFQGFTTFNDPNFVVHTDVTIEAYTWPWNFPPRELQIDTVSSLLTWETPLAATLDEGFSDTLFPPFHNLGYWTTGSMGAGWYRSDNGGSEGFPVPPHEGFYALVNSDLAGEDNDGCCDSLMTWNINLLPRDHFHLRFESFFTGEDGQAGTVFYSTNEGATWDTLYEMTPDTSWQDVDIDLSFMSGFYGEEEAAFLFLANDNGQTGSGWAIDNVRVDAGEYYPEYFRLYANSELVADEIPADTNQWTVPDLQYGNHYSVYLSSYSCVNENMKSIQFTSAFLPPCENFKAVFSEDELNLSARWTVPTLNDSVAKGLTYFKVYMDDEIAGAIPYGGQNIGDTITLNNIDFTSGEHELCVKAYYDLTPYGFPGETGESLFVCDSIDIVFAGLPKESVNAAEIVLFPNPATGHINIRSAETIRQIELFSYAGQMILRKQVEGNAFTLNTNGLKAGLYFARITLDKKIVNKKIVIQ